MIIWHILLVLMAPAQPVALQFDDGRTVEARFMASARLFADGTARGGLTLLHDDPEAPGTWGLLALSFEEGTAEISGEGLSLNFEAIKVPLDSRGDGGGPAERFVVEVGPWAPNQDDPIWQFHSGNVAYDGASLRATTRVAMPGGPGG